MTKAKQPRFLTSHAVAKRAKEIIEQNEINPEETIKNPIKHALNELKNGLININIIEEKLLDVKEDDDTLDALYLSLKKENAAEAEKKKGKAASSKKQKPASKETEASE